MKRRLNGKNKIFIALFIVIILIIVGILVYSIFLVGYNNSNIYTVDNNTVLFANDSSNIDTSSGGKIEKSWDNQYRYVASDNKSYVLGSNPVIYNSNDNKIVLLGVKYQILNDGSVVKNDEMIDIQDLSVSYFYKLDDRKYLIISKDISEENKTIYTKNYLIIDIDKQGNASLLNDSIDVKTINPIRFVFDNYIFDVANEKLIYKETVIDLKQVIGSTNEYKPKEETEKIIKYDSKELIDSYNKLVSDFTKYANNHNYSVSANNQVSGSTTNIVINNNGSSSSNNNNNNNSNNNTSSNKTEILKRVSLRGVVTSTSFIDVSYVVTDPENRYQAVYLLVTGNINNEMTTEKVVLDKYDTKYRIQNVLPNNEYTISLGYIEIVLKNDEKSLVDNIEDVVNVRTQNIAYDLTIEKIAYGRVYFNYKMPSNYAFESAEMAIIVNDEEKKIVNINYKDMISSKGFSSSFELSEGSVYELRVKNARYNNKVIDVNIYKKFALTN